MLQQRSSLLLALFAAILCNAVVYTTMAVLHPVLPFHLTHYKYGAYHYLEDPRVHGGPFLLLRALGQYDAQWYLKIAETGYPSRPTTVEPSNGFVKDSPVYAFFPLYPLLIRLTTFTIGDLEFSAFLLSNLILLANALSLCLVVGKFYTPSIATKTTLLLLVFPFSIFLRSYFAENLQLLLLIWFSYFLMQRKLLPSALILALLNVTKANCLLLNLLFCVYLYQQIRAGKSKPLSGLAYLAIIPVPISVWLLFNYIQTGDPLYFRTVYQTWSATPFYLHAIVNLRQIATVLVSPAQSTIHYSFLDACIVVLAATLLIVSRKSLPRLLWWISLILWLTPLVSHDLMSFARYQSVSFPLFIYVASRLNGKAFSLTLMFLFPLLLIISIMFVNWYWIG